MTSIERPAHKPWLTWLFALLLAAIGLGLAIAGGKLVALGGSPYYVIAGLLVLASAVLLVRRNWLAARLYGLMLVGTIAWAIWEVGFEGWLLLPRILAPLVLGLLFLVPAVREGGGALSARVSAKEVRFGAAALLVAVLAGAGLHAAVGPYTPADPIYQDGVTTAGAAQTVPGLDGRDWSAWGADAAGSRFSALTQINSQNVDKLEIAWTYHVGADPKGQMPAMEAVPLKVGDTLYTCADYNDVIALDAETGQQKWRWHSGLDMSQSKYSHCRGVAYYKVPGATGECAERIYTNTLDARLIAFDAATGHLCQGFGDHGTASLLTGMGEVGQGYYNVTSAPTLVRGKVVLGGMVADGQYWGEPSGVIRAFDAVTGQLAWAFDMGHPERTGLPPAGETYTRSTPNSWAPMSADEALGLVYVPTGNATPDYYGKQRRPFDDKYSSSVVALDAQTGRPRWSFQTTHHDIWDYDVPSQPTLVDVRRPDGGVDHGLIQPTKRGELFYLDRATGKPLAPVTERSVPTDGAAPGERVSPTQPFATGLPSLAGPNLTERSMWGLTPLDQLWCRIDFRQRRYEGPLTPPGLTPGLLWPSYGGGSNWGSITIDRDRGLLIANANRLATRNRLMPRDEANRKGLKALAPGVKIDMSGSVAQMNTPYAAEISPMMSPLNVPCTAPPFATISAIDLRTHKLVWHKSFGTAASSGPFGFKSHLPLPMGVPTMGGSLATRTGLTFIGASPDGYLRAIETTTGREVWKTKPPVPAFSTPISYLSAKSGRQFIVMSDGGLKLMNTPQGDYIVAYALPKSQAAQK